jgi:hypothetical protein
LEEVLPGFEALRREDMMFVADFVEGTRKSTFTFDELSEGQRVLIALYLLINVAPCEVRKLRRTEVRKLWRVFSRWLAFGRSGS